VQYLRLRRYQEAAAESQRAMEIGSPNARDLVNLSVAQWVLNRFDDALLSARQALRLDAGSATAHFVAGSLLTRHPDTLPEAVRHFELAAPEIPLAAERLAKARELLSASK
jgi:tetratricopeptide (TPR) repeat protein